MVWLSISSPIRIKAPSGAFLFQYGLIIYTTNEYFEFHELGCFYSNMVWLSILTASNAPPVKRKVSIPIWSDYLYLNNTGIIEETCFYSNMVWLSISSFFTIPWNISVSIPIWSDYLYYYKKRRNRNKSFYSNMVWLSISSRFNFKRSILSFYSNMVWLSI